MMNSLLAHTNNKGLRIVLAVLAIEWLLFIFSGVSYSFLHKDPFFSLGVDPLYWIFYAVGIPQFILSQQWLAISCDIIVTVLLAFLIIKPGNNRIAIGLMAMLLLFYVTLTGYHSHRNFQAGFFLVLLAFIFRPGKSRVMAYEATRYFLLFFYLSSALLKLFSPSLFDTTLFSEFLKQQFVPYFLENNTGWRTNLNLYLSGNAAMAQIIFFAGIVVELSALAGFFTKKYDWLLGCLLISFHFGNWILMDIAPFGQIAFVCLLFVGKAFHTKEST
ncbi:MAG: hypothetical protein EOP53_02615 [Sphingobacteriales bacterium]|nr:MAG: hypothetical protein EOP53_02615 [Sphingobacteriales bacterium]